VLCVCLVSADKAKAFAEENGLSLVETSAKDNSNVEFAFQKLITEIYQETVKKNMLDNDQGGEFIPSSGQRIDLKPPPNQPPAGDGGCKC